MCSSALFLEKNTWILAFILTFEENSATSLNCTFFQILELCGACGTDDYFGLSLLFHQEETGAIPIFSVQIQWF